MITEDFKFSRIKYAAELAKKTGDLSIQQLTVYHTIMTVFRVVKSRKPEYLSNKLKLKKQGDEGVISNQHY